MVPHEALYLSASVPRRSRSSRRRLLRVSDPLMRRKCGWSPRPRRPPHRQQQPDEPANPLEEPDVDPNVDLFAAVEQNASAIGFLPSSRKRPAGHRHGRRTGAGERSQGRRDVIRAGATRLLAGLPPSAQYAAAPSSSWPLATAAGPAAAREQEWCAWPPERGMRPAQYLYQMAGLDGTRPWPDRGQPRPPRPRPAAPRHSRPQPACPGPHPAAGAERAQFTTLSGGGGAPTSGVTLASMVDLPREFSQDRRARRSEVAKLLVQLWYSGRMATPSMG